MKRKVKKDKSPGTKELKEKIASLCQDRDSFRAELTKMEEKLSKSPSGESQKKRSQLELIGEIEDDLRKKYTVIKNIKHELLETQEKVTETEKTIKARDDKITDLTEAVSELKHKVDDQKKKNLEDIKELNQTKDEQTEKLKEEIDNLKKYMAKLEESNQANEARAGLLAERDDEISNLKQSIEGMEEAVKTKDEGIQEFKEEVTRLKADITWLKELNEAFKVQREVERKKKRMTPEPNKTLPFPPKADPPLAEKKSGRSIPLDNILREKDAEIEKLKGEIFSLRELISTQKSFIARLEKTRNSDGEDTRS